MEEETLDLPEGTGEEATDDAEQDLFEAMALAGLDELSRREGGGEALACLMEACGPLVRDMSPAERRQYCADMEAAKTEAGRKTLGRAFNAVAGAARKRAPEGSELGKKIMAERSANGKRTEEHE